MRHPVNRRFALGFLVAILAPLLVLVVLGVRVIRQEKELAGKHEAEERERRIVLARQELLATLERIKLQELSARSGQGPALRWARRPHAAVVFVAPIEDGRLVAPWEAPAGQQAFSEQVNGGAFGRMLAHGEQQELRARDLTTAAGAYRECLRLARHPVQAAYARLLLARVLAKSGGKDAAVVEYRRLLDEPAAVMDDEGVPVALYAASRLLQAGRDRDTVRRRVESVLAESRWLSPAAHSLLHDLSREPGEAEIARKAAKLANLSEQILELQAQLPRLSPAADTARNGESVWIAWGEEPWLVGTSGAIGDLPPTVLAVSAGPLLEPLRQTGLIVGRQAKGQNLGDNFPGLKVAFAPGSAANGTGRRWFYLLALVVACSTTVLGGYLLWRDLRRELRMAEMRTQFVSSVSHELKTPLTAIRMFADTLRMRRLDSGTQEEYLGTIASESERLTRLVDNVLDFSRIERGKKMYQLRPASLENVVGAAARAVQHPLAQLGFNLRVEVDNDLPPVRADADALEQAVLNLLSNAMKYSGESRAIDLRLRRDDGRAVIEVTDYGVGIAPEEQQRIFEKFHRVPSKENELVPGTGLGLTLVEHIAKAHEGEVTVRSAPGKGSTFSLRIPMENGA